MFVKIICVIHFLNYIYVFINFQISLLDGLPPLICKKCESMLSHHAQVKEMLHEKQKSLIKKFKENVCINTFSY